MTDKKSNDSRRKLLKSIAAGGGAVVAGQTLPKSWSKPVVDSIVLPVHAETTPMMGCLLCLEIGYEMTGTEASGGGGFEIWEYKKDTSCTFIDGDSESFESGKDSFEFCTTLAPGIYQFSGGIGGHGTNGIGRFTARLQCCTGGPETNSAEEGNEGDWGAETGFYATIEVEEDGTCTIQLEDDCGSCIDCSDGG